MANCIYPTLSNEVNNYEVIIPKYDLKNGKNNNTCPKDIKESSMCIS